jgi:hypothetical protein
MRRFYALLKASEGARFDPARAAELEVEWWRAHREGRRTAGWVRKQGPSRRRG